MANVTSPRSSARPGLDVPLSWGGELSEWIRLVALAVQGLLDGKIRATGTVTLRANETTTTLTDLRIGPDTVILLMPTTANAAGALATTYVSSRGKQTATITHANTADTDKTFGYALLG